jgi:hypothetical protein
MKAYKPHNFAQAIFQLNGMPLQMPKESMHHLWPIYDQPSRSLLLKFGRQTHKSSTMGYTIALPCLRYRHYHSLYVAPTGNQVSVFSTDKLNGALRGSATIDREFMDTETKDQVGYKELRNGSKMYLRSAFHTADAIRGISADSCSIDEIQDIISDHIPVIEQCMSHSLAKWEHMQKTFPDLPMHLFNHKMYAGTPKTAENTLERYWNKSTKTEWIIKCLACNKHNYIDDKNVGPVCLICRACEKPIFYENGQWVRMNEKGVIDGYRLPQVVLNWVNNRRHPEVWFENVVKPRQLYTEEKFFNECLALPYANARNPLSRAEMEACCKSYRFVEPGQLNNVTMGSKLYAGIDWGKGDMAQGTSYSHLWIGGFYGNVFKIVFAKKYTGKMSDPIEQMKDMINIINQFRVDMTIADSGDGRTSNAFMVKALGAMRFAEVYEHGTMAKKVNWKSDQGLYLINRTLYMTDVMMEIKRQQIEFPCVEDMDSFIPDFTNIYEEYSEATRMKKYDHNQPDDGFHAYMFCRFAAGLRRGEYNGFLMEAKADKKSASAPISM